jgi:replication-associated recombination protein RarA
MAVRFSEQETPNGHRCDEAASALQKSLRRCEERQALYWTSELDLAGYGNYAWKRLRVIASEDVGLAEPHLAATVRALYENWKEAKREKRGESSRIFLVHAVCLLARARKSRMIDHALLATYRGERPRREVPEHALDKHTARGRRLGRGFEHFFDQGAQLANAAEVDDPYADEARAACLGAQTKEAR